MEFGTTLEAYEQNADGVAAHLVTTRNGIETEESLTIGWLVGADGPKSWCFGGEILDSFKMFLLGGIRQRAGITYLGETRDDQRFIIGDVHVQSGLSRLVSPIQTEFD